MEDRYYQEVAAAWLSRRRRGLLVAPAGSGKTLIAARALAKVLNAKPRTECVNIGWICATIEQKDQAVAALAEFPEINQLAKVSVACAQAEVNWSARDVLVVDECHHLPAPQWFAQVKDFTGCLWGLTATPWSEYDRERNRVLRDLFDHQIWEVSRDEVAHKMAPAQVISVDVPSPGVAAMIEFEVESCLRRWDKMPERYHRCSRVDYEIRMRSLAAIDLGIVHNVQRNSRAVEIALKHESESVIVLVPTVELAQSMAAKILGAVACFSGMKQRATTMERFRVGDLRCVVATSLLDEGFDAPIANVLVMVSGGRSQARTIQRTGRVLRQYEGKERGLIYDFLDSDIPTLHNQAKARLRIYRKLGYQIGQPQPQPDCSLL